MVCIYCSIFLSLCDAGQILASESLFTYPTGMSSGDFSNLSFVPVFLDEIPSLSSAQEVCGNDSQCAYDFIQTGNMELALCTLETNRENEMAQLVSGM